MLSTRLDVCLRFTYLWITLIRNDRFSISIDIWITASKWQGYILFETPNRNLRLVLIFASLLHHLLFHFVRTNGAQSKKLAPLFIPFQILFYFCTLPFSLHTYIDKYIQLLTYFMFYIVMIKKFFSFKHILFIETREQ